MPAAALPDPVLVPCVLLILLIPLAAAGIALINTGLGRAHSAAHCMLSSLCVFSVSAAAFFVCGFAWQGYSSLPGHLIFAGGKSWGWIGAQPFFLIHFPLDGSRASLALLFGMFAAGLAAIIPLGAGIDRWRLSASCASAAVLGGFTFPIFAHWVWGGGWLAALGANYGLGQGFLDAGGSATIQAMGGFTALSIAWQLGPRRGKYSHDGLPTAVPGHNVVLVQLGCLLALVGWLGLNSAGAILFAGADPGRIVLVAVNTVLSAGAAGLVAVVVTGMRFGRPDVSISANGWVGGLAASSASCAFVQPVVAVVIGVVAGALVTLSVEWFEARFSVDDPGGAVSVHAIGGLWGLLALGLFASADLLSGGVSGSAGSSVSQTVFGQWLAQIVGIATLLGFVLPFTYGVNRLLGLAVPYRVPPEAEEQGLDLYELGAGAYPEFVTHTDEFSQR